MSTKLTLPAGVVTIAIGSLFLIGCQQTMPPGDVAYEAQKSSVASRAATVGSAHAPSPQDRPGLGTGWGENRRSRVSGRQFGRVGNEPWATAKFFYNDEEGARAMATNSGFAWKQRGPITVARGSLSVGLKGGAGGYLRSFSARGDAFFIGEEGDRYVIALKNNTPTRLEVVVSVDGLDVLDGKRASFSKRGYLIEPRGSLTIDGFRRSDSQVAAFRFSGVADSYAARTGSSRNVGVIGLAVFPEHGRDPFSLPDTHLRKTAEPFAREYAQPPGR